MEKYLKVKRGENLKYSLRKIMENVRERINIFSVFSAIWKSKPEVEIDGEQEEVIGKLAPQQAIELKKSLARAEKLEGELENVKNRFIKTAKIKGKTAKVSKNNVIQEKNIEKEERE